MRNLDTKVFFSQRRNDCRLVPAGTFRRRTAPHWLWSTTNTSTSKPNCGCSKCSSAKETPLNSSE